MKQIVRSILQNSSYSALFASIVVHSLIFSIILPEKRFEPAKRQNTVKVAIKEVKKEIEEKIEPVPPKPKPKKPRKKKKLVEKVPSITPSKKKTAKKKNKPKPTPVLGLSKESFAKNKAPGGISVPAGNTTMMVDEGKRLRPEDIAKLDVDLSEDARLIVESFEKPQYTVEAEDSGLEGRFVIDVYVDASGRVIEVDLRKKIGFGMDKRVIASIKNARFQPRKNALGKPISGWTELKVRLTIE